MSIGEAAAAVTTDADAEEVAVGVVADCLLPAGGPGLSPPSGVGVELQAAAPRSSFFQLRGQAVLGKTGGLGPEGS